MSDRLERLRAARLHHQRSAPDPDALVRGTIGLHSTDYATPYLSARARIPEFEAAPLFARLNASDGLVRVNAMRNTVHVVHTDDLPMIVAATGASVAATGRRVLKDRSDAEIEAGVEALCAVLSDGPLGSNEIKAALPSHAQNVRYWLLVAMGTGRVIRAETPKIRSNRTRYALLRQRVPGFEPVPASEARRALLLRAVRTFGPVTVEDLAWWLPAPKGEVGRALASDPTLRRLEAAGRTWWYADGLGDTAPPPRDAHGAWLLPYEDALLKGYLDRAWCLAPGLKPVLFPYSVAHWHPPDGNDPGSAPNKGPNVTGEARPSIWWGGPRR